MVGAWWMVTLLFSLCLVRRIPYKDQKPQFGEKLLVENHSSPVGYQVPSLPDFEIDPGMATKGSKCLSIQFEFLVGVILAFGVGGCIIALGFTSWDENFYDQVSGAVRW